MKFYKLFTLLSLLSIVGCSGPNNPKQSEESSLPESEIERSIIFERSYISIETDDTYKVNYTLEGFLEGEEHMIEWTSSNDQIASVDDLGYVYGVGDGTTIIKASYLDAEASMTVNVVSSGEVPTFDCLENIEVYIGETIDFNAKTKFRGQEVDASYTYVSSDPSVVEVANNGLRSIKEGKADITITSTYRNFENVRVCKVNVIPHVAIVLNHDYLSLAYASYTGSSYIKEAQLSAKAYINDVETNVTFMWASSDINVATVEDGLVKSVKEGKALITCSFEKDAKTYQKNITVNVRVPTNYIGETYTVNMLDESRYIDITALGLSASGLTSVAMKNDDDDFINVDYTLNGDRIYFTVNDSFKGLTKQFRFEVDGEYYFANIAFNDYVKDKLFFADSKEHISDLTVLHDATISYDSSRSITVSDVKGADKDNFANEKTGSVKVQLTGRNEEALILNNPMIPSLTNYNYIVFYVYTEIAGYNCGTWVVDGADLEPFKWNKVMIDDFSKVMDYKGDMLTDKHYDPTGFGVRFTNYESPTKKDVVWVSSIYVGSKPNNKLITMGVGLVSTFWWVNGVKITTSASYVDYYGHISTTVGVDYDDLQDEDKPYLKYEDSSCMEITYGGSKNIEAFFFPGQCPLNGYTDLVFYVMTEASRASEMGVYNYEKTLTASLIPGHWTRVHIDLVKDQTKSQNGSVIVDVQDLNGFFFGISVGGKALTDTKFYVSSVYGFNY